MPYEMLVGLHVIDDAGYATYRESMLPILHSYGGSFRFDATIEKLLISADEEINRVFIISFENKQQKEAFFANSEYRNIRAKFFDPSVAKRVMLLDSGDK